MAGRADRRVGEAEPEAEAQGIGEKQQQDRRRRQHEDDAEEIAIVEAERKPSPSQVGARPGLAEGSGARASASSIASPGDRRSALPRHRSSSALVIALGAIGGALRGGLRSLGAGAGLREHVDADEIAHHRRRGAGRACRNSRRRAHISARRGTASSWDRRSRSDCRSRPAGAARHSRSTRSPRQSTCAFSHMKRRYSRTALGYLV